MDNLRRIYGFAWSEMCYESPSVRKVDDSRKNWSYDEWSNWFQSVRNGDFGDIKLANELRMRVTVARLTK